MLAYFDPRLRKHFFVSGRALFSALSGVNSDKPKDASKELFRQCRPDVRKLNAEGRKQCRLRARREWARKNLTKDFKP